MYLLNNNKKGIQFDITGWMIIGIVALVVLIGLVVLFARSSWNIISILPF
jgi:hypothetical protein